MPFKPKVYEFCSRCKKRAAWLCRDGSVKEWHDCPAAPPGPPNPPWRWRPGEVEFVRQEACPEENQYSDLPLVRE